MLTCDITVAVMKIFLILTGQNVAVHLVTCDSGLVSEMVLVAEDRGLVGAVTSDQVWCRDSWGLVGAGEEMVTSLPSPADTGSGSSSRSHFPSLEAFSLTKGAGWAGAPRRRQ